MNKTLKKLMLPLYRYILLNNRFYKESEPIFICGAGHSGTSLMLRILSYHKDIYTISYESRVFFKSGVQDLKLLEEWEHARIKSGKLRIIEKTPGHIKKIDHILKIFPKAKFIIMVRDGRDTAISMKKRFGDAKIGIEKWVEYNNIGLKHKSNPLVHYQKLEKLTTELDQQLKNICSFLDLDYYSDLLNFNDQEFKYGNREIKKSKSVKEGEGHKTHRTWQVNQKIFNTSRWELESDDEDLRLFEQKEFKQLMKKFEYI